MKQKFFFAEASKLELIATLRGRQVLSILAEVVLKNFEDFAGAILRDPVNDKLYNFLRRDELTDCIFAFTDLADAAENYELEISISRREWNNQIQHQVRLTAKIEHSQDGWRLLDKPLVWGRWKADKMGVVALLAPEHPLYLQRLVELQVAAKEGVSGP